MNAKIATPSSTIACVSPKRAAEFHSSALFLDVRTPVEFEEAHIEGSLLHPLSQLNAGEIQQHLTNDKSAYVIICRSGSRARQAAEKLAAAGLRDLYVLEGGILAWEDSGLPLIRGSKTISLERQVRIAAGTLVLVGALLGFFVHPAWMALSAVVGAGLIFAGITDTCGMGMILAQMPWNLRCSQKAGASSCCQLKK